LLINDLQAGKPPAEQQTARLGVALAIIAEHSFFLWDQDPFQDCVAMAVDLYMRSHHSIVIKCVDETFRENQMDSGDFTQVQRSKAFGQKLIQIALDNQLGKGLDFQPVQVTPDNHSLSTEERDVSIGTKAIGKKAQVQAAISRQLKRFKAVLH